MHRGDSIDESTSATTHQRPRPRVICHMATSIDGRIVVDGWPDRASTAVRRQYEEVHERYNADGWQSNEIGGDHVVALLSERVSDEYLLFLRERAVSYLLAGARDVDLLLALEKIAERFAVKTLMLEGGGKINGGFLRAGLVDEVSVLVAPAVDGRVGTPAVFDSDDDNFTPRELVLEAIERRAGDVVWLRYSVRP